MMKLCALIADSTVVNVIVLGADDDVVAAATSLGVDLGIDVTDWQPQRPGPGWLWDGKTFSSPPEPEPDPEA